VNSPPPDPNPAPQAARRGLDALLRRPAKASPAPRCATFKEFLRHHARVLRRDGTGGAFSLEGRAPLEVVVDWLDKILRNTIGLQDHRTTGPQDHRTTGRQESQSPVVPLSRSPVVPFGPQEVEIDGVRFGPGQLKGATLAVAGGAQFGKTVLELNLMAYATAIRFLSVGNYLPDRPKVEEIVGQKFRPNVLDLYPWMAQMIQLGKTQNASGKTINRKESFTVTDGQRKSFGNFCGMHRPPTSLTLDLALLDEVDDIDDRNIGYVDARMTNSRAHLTCFIGTQRAAGAGQNARLQASSFHVKMVPCPNCGKEWCLEEEFPRCVRVHRGLAHAAGTGRAMAVDSWQLSVGSCSLRCLGAAEPDGTTANCQLSTDNPDPIITPEMGHDRLATYYAACPECGTELDRDAGRYVARHPERIAQARLGIRVSQLNISAISLQEIVGAWYAAFDDPAGAALSAFCCDRLAIPHAGAAQPITQAVLDDCRKLGLGQTVEAAEPYAMSLDRTTGPQDHGLRTTGPQDHRTTGPQDSRTTGPQETSPVVSSSRGPVVRVAGMDLGPRCWFWCDEVRGPFVSACVWAELIASGSAPSRVPLLMNALGVSCILLDAGGEPDLTKRLVLALNGLENYTPPAVSPNELLKMRLSFPQLPTVNGPLPRPSVGSGQLSVGLSWDGDRACWRGLRAAAVLFVPGHARGIEQTLGFTQDGRIYPLIKCNRGESIQTAVNDFLTPAEGVIEMLRNSTQANKANEEVKNPSLSSLPSVQIRSLPRARLPQTYIGPGVSQAVLDGHLLNLRRQRNPRTQAEDWLEGVENHLGLAKTYARLAQTLCQTEPAPPFGAISTLEGIRLGPTRGLPQFLPPKVHPFR